MKKLNGLKIPQDYCPTLSIKDTAIAIKKIKDFFEISLASALNLTRVSAPLFVRPETGMNDNLSGVEKPVNFKVKSIGGRNVEIVHSLAKWKRVALKRYGFGSGEGLYTDMNAIRKDEELDNLHSIYVDQWDWEAIIKKEERTEDKLKSIVLKIHNVLKDTESMIHRDYPCIPKELPEDIFFITTQELEDIYPLLTPKEREDAICKEKKAVFLSKIGGHLKSGIKHDGRAPDYDDWTLNGDILLWYPLLETTLEISSMGIRVDEDSLISQLKESGCLEKKELDYHKDLLSKRLPYTVGGGIGQSRLCMYFLKKAHVGEVQASVWPDSTIDVCKSANIYLL